MSYFQDSGKNFNSFYLFDIFLLLKVDNFNTYEKNIINI